MSADAYETFKETSLTTPVVRLSYKHVNAKLLVPFQRKHAEIVERYKFQLIYQEELESIQQTVRILKRKVINYDYGEGTSTMLRGQFVVGIYDEFVRKWTEQQLKFEKTVEIANVPETCWKRCTRVGTAE